MAVHGEVIKAAPLTVGDLAQLVGILSGTAVFLVLIGLDLRNAIRKGAHWVPGHALILSALTIQALNFVQNQGALLDRMLDNSKPKQPLSGDVLKNNLFMIHSGRVMLCVLLAFFLPGMARPRYQEKWTKIIALGLNVFLDLFSELLTVRRRLGHSDLATYLASFIASDAIISITLIWLIVLLICATLASKSIRNLATQRILYILGNPEAEEGNWKALEDQVLKSWIVSRACHPESIIASSVLGSSAAFGVTACVLFSIAGWIVQGPGIKFLGGAEFWLKFIITIMQVIFILIGWLAVCWRWLTASAYYEEYYRNQCQSESYDRSEDQSTSCCRNRCFLVEDFWTRHIVEHKEAEESRLNKLNVDERISKVFARKLTNLKVNEANISIMTPTEVKKKFSLKVKFLLCVIWFQWLVVLLSKAFSFFIVYTLYNKLTRCLVQKIILKSHLEKVNNDYDKAKNIVENVKILWQTPRSVFLTNRRSIKHAKQIIAKGKRDGKSCHVLITLLPQYKERQKHDRDVRPEFLDPGSALVQTRLKYLCHRKVDQVLGSAELNDYLMRYMRKQSSKLTAVSLIYIIVKLSPTSEAGWRDRLQEYYEAWELMDLVESSEPATLSLLSKAADSLFNDLNDTIEKEKSNKQMEEPKAQNKTPMSMEEAEKAIQTLAEECKDKFDEKAKFIDKGQDRPVDWENLVAWNALYRLCMSTNCSSGNIADLMKELNNSLEDIIGHCLDLVGQVLVEKCPTWAQDSEKKKLLEALYVAGKCSGLMEQFELDEVRVQAEDSR